MAPYTIILSELAVAAVAFLLGAMAEHATQRQVPCGSSGKIVYMQTFPLDEGRLLEQPLPEQPEGSAN